MEVCDEVDGEDVEGDEFVRVLKRFQCRAGVDIVPLPGNPALASGGVLARLWPWKISQNLTSRSRDGIG